MLSALAGRWTACAALILLLACALKLTPIHQSDRTSASSTRPQPASASLSFQSAPALLQDNDARDPPAKKPEFVREADLIAHPLPLNDEDERIRFADGFDIHTGTEQDITGASTLTKRSLWHRATQSLYALWPSANTASSAIEGNLSPLRLPLPPCFDLHVVQMSAR
jgi:hypothetical protein